ncbi:NmrA family NAD(P)-binding protein [Umezawaea tangerina]|uniref:NAD(P)H dehydrogenase (Quinone) n=1 Tax=Umezawaea tangerina TaxID=84725 RepID=A0A2T0TDD8_9PSEU|nr:NmrA family NAD(P)-binding protein [Umezawaea tangerina]PRY43677.1 NAD(P)H dehydrogenase (quinone) [Umezawaea tangerina]
MILVTGASGALGGLVLDRLAGHDVVAGSRTPVGDTARLVDFDRPETLATAFDGVDVLVFVSAGYADDDVVLARHGAVVDAATGAGVRHVVYTSLVGSGDGLGIALAHRWTEARLAAAPFAVTVLRNGLYAEIPASLAVAAAESGVLEVPWGEGRLSVVAREDLADVTAKVALSSADHVGRCYELEGVTAVGGQDVADALTGALGRPITYRPAPLGSLWQLPQPPFQVAHTVSLCSNVNAGRLDLRPGDLPALLDAPPRSALDLITAAARPPLG